MSIKMRWSMVLGLFTILVVILSGLGLYTTKLSQSAIRELNEVNVDQRTLLNRAFSQQWLIQSQMRDIRARLLSDNWTDKPRELAADITDLNKNIDSLEQFIDGFLALPAQPSQTEQLNAIRDSFRTLLDDGLLPQQQRLAESNTPAFTSHAPQTRELIVDFEKASTNFFDTASQQGAALYSNFLERANTLQWTVLAVLIISLLTVAVALWDMFVNIARPLVGLLTYFGAVEQGDLSRRIPEHEKNALIPICIGRLYASLSKMQSGLVGMVGGVRNSGDLIYQGSQHIAAGNGDLSARTEQQAASLEETASSMEELSSTVSQNADNARQASQLAREASSAASRGGEVVSDVVKTMQDIRTGSHHVADIISTIDAIAFQTNILALNASVEAARAGEHGRGFAVVAEEVRKLASRSSDAASEIRELIDASLKQVEAGTLRVDDAGQVMKELVSAVANVSDIMDEIASASVEQSHGIQQINEAVTQMEQVTQQNSLLVQQSASASQQLEAEARQLSSTVGRFRIAEHEQSRGEAAQQDERLARWMPALTTEMKHQGSVSREGHRDEEWEPYGR
ncbi:methyl-accepting chemotaxis protein [Halomonas cupida]|nr:methyl-accepting chemotaxis protein [Halomonas cupida]